MALFEYELNLAHVGVCSHAAALQVDEQIIDSTTLLFYGHVR